MIKYFDTTENAIFELLHKLKPENFKKVALLNPDAPEFFKTINSGKKYYSTLGALFSVTIQEKPADDPIVLTAIQYKVGTDRTTAELFGFYRDISVRKTIELNYASIEEHNAALMSLYAIENFYEKAAYFRVKECLEVIKETK